MRLLAKMLAPSFRGKKKEKRKAYCMVFKKNIPQSKISNNQLKQGFPLPYLESEKSYKRRNNTYSSVKMDHFLFFLCVCEISPSQFHRSSHTRFPSTLCFSVQPPANGILGRWWGASWWQIPCSREVALRTPPASLAPWWKLPRRSR